MDSIKNALESLDEDFKAADKVVDDIYSNYFAKYFSKVSEMHTRFSDINVSITDKELEWIITSLPLDLFAASDALAQFKQHNEIVKLTIKQRKQDKKAEEIDEEYKLMSIVYSSVIAKVEHQISFSKELIMGAKKVWDARKRTEQSNPINEVTTPDLPDYKPIKKTGPMTYIKGVDYEG